VGVYPLRDAAIVTATDRELRDRHELQSLCGQISAERLAQAVAREPLRLLPPKLTKARPMKFLSWVAAPHPR
jgi:hypothetical protein